MERSYLKALWLWGFGPGLSTFCIPAPCSAIHFAKRFAHREEVRIPRAGSIAEGSSVDR